MSKYDPNQKAICMSCDGCKGSRDEDGAYCHRLDMCIEWNDPFAVTVRDGRNFVCDGKQWIYPRPEQLIDNPENSNPDNEA